MIIQDEQNHSKVCSKCKQEKEIREFSRMSTTKDGRRPSCKSCGKLFRERKKLENPLDTKIYSMASAIVSRVINNVDYKKNKCYKNYDVKCLLGKIPSEIAFQLKIHFGYEIERMMNEGKNPSIDRIDPTGNYELGNIRVITLEENVSLGNKKGTALTSKPILVTFIDGRTKIYKSVSECSRELSLSRSTIIIHRDNGTRTTDGMSFSLT